MAPSPDGAAAASAGTGSRSTSRRGDCGSTDGHRSADARTSRAGARYAGQRVTSVMSAGRSDSAVAPQFLNEVPLQTGERATGNGVGEEREKRLLPVWKPRMVVTPRGSHTALTSLGFSDQFAQERGVCFRAGVSIDDPHLRQRFGTEGVRIWPAEVLGRVGAQRRASADCASSAAADSRCAKNSTGRLSRSRHSRPGLARRDLPEARKQVSASSKRCCALSMRPRLSLASDRLGSMAMARR